LVRARQQSIEHRLRQAPSEGILLTDMVGAQQANPRQLDLRTVRELRPRSEASDALPLREIERGIPRDATQRDPDPNSRQGRALPIQPVRTGLDLVELRLVARRRAAHGRADPDPLEAHAISAAD
jgi:hypothetical protein